MFNRDNCKFRFATHLFSTELSQLQDGKVLMGRKFRISPNCPLNRNVKDTTLTQDFCTQLDSLMKTLAKTEPQFIRCLAPSSSGSVRDFSRSLVSQQLRSLQILDTVRVMASGFSYRVKFQKFYQQYGCLMINHGGGQLDMRIALVQLGQTLQTIYESVRPHFSRQLSVCDSHVLLSECGRQFLEQLRAGKRNNAAKTVQTWWRSVTAAARVTLDNPASQLVLDVNRNCASTPDMLQLPDVDVDMLKLTCQFLGKDWVRINLT